jgi:hypothetical protein
MTIHRNLAVLAPAAGLVLGFLDFVWIRYVPSPFGGLGNSIAVWAVAAFLLAFWSRWSLPRAVVGSVVLLVVAVPSYYLAAALIQGDDLSNAYSSVAFLWMGLGVVAGAVFGAGGALARGASRWQTPALALPAAVLLAEAALQLSRLGEPSYRLAAILASVCVLAALAVGVTLLVARTWRTRGLALAYAVPLAAVGFPMLLASGFR